MLIYLLDLYFTCSDNAAKDFSHCHRWRSWSILATAAFCRSSVPRKSAWPTWKPASSDVASCYKAEVNRASRRHLMPKSPHVRAQPDMQSAWLLPMNFCRCILNPVTETVPTFTRHESAHHRSTKSRLRRQPQFPSRCFVWSLGRKNCHLQNVSSCWNTMKHFATILHSRFELGWGRLQRIDVWELCATRWL